MRKTSRYVHDPRKSETLDTFIILSAGVGRRMRTQLPKSLLVYQGKRLIDHQIEAIHKQSIKADVIVVAGFKFNSMLCLPYRLIENVFYETTNSSESLRLAINASQPSNLYIIHGDIIFHRDAINLQNPESPSIVIDKSNRICNREVGVCHQNGKVLNMSYGLPDKWCQILYIPRDKFDLVKQSINKINKSWATFEFINSLLDKMEFVVHENRQHILEIDSTKDLK